ncbi:MAG TPA: patatin-like phospholipase family protein, partial [Mycobacterium sp.]|nr:patatin-like phospholipase family protein [Mycobacterium sp.]
MRVALALGGGGARGYAHIGVIQVLQERGFDIVGLSGCS